MIKAQTKTFWKTTIALSIGSLLTFANIYITQPLLPIFTDEFLVSPLMSSMSVSLVILAIGISLFFYGPISDSIGRRGIMITTMTLAVITTFLAAFAPNFETLLIIRVIQGVFLAGLPSIALAYIGEEFSAKAVSLAIGVYIGGNTIGGMFGRVLGGIMADAMNWRWAFIAMGVVSIICLLLFVILLKPSKHFKQKPFDWHQAIQQYKQHITNKELRIAYLVGGVHFLIFVGIFNYVTYLLSSSPYELPASLLGLLFLTYLAGTLSSPIAGKLSVRFPKSFCNGFAIIIMGLGFAVTLIPHLWAVIGGLILTCFGFFFSHSVASSWVSNRARYAKASASGLYLIFYYIGGSLGPLYLYPFWTILQWKGVVLGCLLVLGITLYLSIHMYRVETDEFIENSTNNRMIS